MRLNKFACWSLLLIWAATAVSAPAEAADPAPPATQAAGAAAVPDEIAKALQLPNGVEQTKALLAAATEWAKKDPPKALAWAVGLPASPTNKQIVISLSQAWATRDGSAAVTWGMALHPKTYQGYDTLALHIMICKWAALDPKAATAWAETVPSDAGAMILDLVYVSIPDGWGRAGGGAAMAAWAEAIKNDKYRQTAIVASARYWSESKPDEAAAWAKRLPEKEMQWAALPIFQKLKKGDATQATQWLDALPLPEEVKLDWKKKP